jgi:hypothetical protein
MDVKFIKVKPFVESVLQPWSSIQTWPIARTGSLTVCACYWKIATSGKPEKFLIST